ncbi:MAG: DEAD/DEAH box helicase [Bacilli bacterium]|nr:DEAD/DEAH box helicase [Bacilli bacterium]
MKDALEYGSYTSSVSKKIKENVLKVNDLKDKYSSISDEEFINITNDFRNRLRNGETIEDIMVEALAVAREATKRALGKTPYDVQIEAAMAMLGEVIGTKEDDGEYTFVREKVIAEMKTGEGKTLVQILIAYLNLLEATVDEDKSKWKSVHIMTANDALAERDAKSNGKVFELLGFSCSFVGERKALKSQQEVEKNKKEKQRAYSCDVVYATATTIAFDYLDSNMVFDPKDRFINKEFGFAIVDEADDILLDKASTPLIISGPPDEEDEEYKDELDKNALIQRKLLLWATDALESGTISVKVFNKKSDDKNTFFDEDFAYFRDVQEVEYTSDYDRIIKILSYAKKRLIKNELKKPVEEQDKSFIEFLQNNDETFVDTQMLFALQTCMIAKYSILKDVNYTLSIKNGVGEIVLIDSNTGRELEKTKYTKELQEAIEVKEIYKMNNHEYGDIKGIRLSNPTDTKAKCTYPSFLSIYKGNVCGMTGTSDEEEFKSLYGFKTYYVPTRLPCVRKDTENEYYLNEDSKLDSIIEIVKQCMITGQPVLIGTTSEIESIKISERLKALHIRHQLLNINNAHIENDIISNAGLMGSITVATNMAGRGTDIPLGPGVKEIGGLYVIGTTRNKSKRIDRQLRGRSGRQGDPGVSKYFCSLDDEIVATHIKKDLLVRFKKYISDKAGRIVNKRIIKEINRALSNRESLDKANRRQLEELNKSYNMQRNALYDSRRKILELSDEELIDLIRKYIDKYIEIIVERARDDSKISLGHLIDIDSLQTKNKKDYKKNLKDALNKKFDEILRSVNKEKYLKDLKKRILKTIDRNWHDYMEELEYDQPTSSVSQESLPDYNYRMAKKFMEELAPSIMENAIHYALFPNNSFFASKQEVAENNEMVL